MGMVKACGMDGVIRQYKLHTALLLYQLALPKCKILKCIIQIMEFTGLLLLLCTLLFERVSAVLEHGDIRLVNSPGGELCEGRLEIYHSTEFVRGWFAVCDRSIGEDELSVVCRQLGCPFSTPSRTGVTNYGERSGYMMALKRDCAGHERDFSNCVATDTYECDYRETDLVGVRCNGGNKVQMWTALTITIAVLALFFSS